MLKKILGLNNIKIKCLIFNRNQSWEFFPELFNDKVSSFLKNFIKSHPEVNPNLKKLFS